MNNERQKATKGKSVKPKPKPASDGKNSKRFMPFRAFKFRNLSSKIAGHVKSKGKGLEQKKLPKSVTPVATQSAKLKKPDVPKKPKLAKKINTNLPPPSAVTSIKEVTNNTKTFDISSFPRVFSTSDLMEKMNEGNNPAHRCSFQQEVISDIESTDEGLCNENLVHLMSNSDEQSHQEFSQFNFPGANFMVFNNKRRNEVEDKLTQAEIDLECKNIDIKNLSNMLQEKTQDLVIKEQKEKILAQKLDQKEAHISKLREECEALKRDHCKYDKTIKELQNTIHALEEQLDRTNHKGHVKLGEYEKLRERIREFENERESMLVEANKMRRELKEKSDLIDSLTRRNEHLQKQNDLLNVTKKENRIYNLEYRVDALQDQVNKVRHENEKLKKTYTYTVNELAEYEMKQMKLREIIDKQKNSLKVLESSGSTENRQIQNYELENIKLREINRNLYAENEKFRQENAHLLHLMSIVPPARKGAPPKHIIQHTYKERPQIMESDNRENPVITLPSPDPQRTPQATMAPRNRKTQGSSGTENQDSTSPSTSNRLTSQSTTFNHQETNRKTSQETATKSNRKQTPPPSLNRKPIPLEKPTSNRKQTPQETEPPKSSHRQTQQETEPPKSNHVSSHQESMKSNHKHTRQETEPPKSNHRHTHQETAVSSHRQNQQETEPPKSHHEQTQQEAEPPKSNHRHVQQEIAPPSYHQTPQGTEPPKSSHRHTQPETAPPSHRQTPQEAEPPKSTHKNTHQETAAPSHRQTPQEIPPPKQHQEQIQQETEPPKSAHRRSPQAATPPKPNHKMATQQRASPVSHPKHTPQTSNRNHTSQHRTPPKSNQQTPQQTAPPTDQQSSGKTPPTTDRRQIQQETALSSNRKHNQEIAPTQPTPSREIPPISAPPIISRHSPQMSISMQDENYGSYENYEAMPSDDLKETPESMAPPHKFSDNLIPMAPTRQCNETPALDEKHLALYLVQTPGSTPKKKSGHPFKDIRNLKTTIMQAFQRHHKPK